MSGDSRRRILVYCPQSHGGIAEYAHYQAKALQTLGCMVTMLAAPDFLEGRAVPYRIVRSLPSAPAGGTGIGRKARHALWLVQAPWRLAAAILDERPAAILFASYSEYLSPFWVWPHMMLRRFMRIRYGANLHDPVRDFRLGPAWWHRASVALAYRIFDYVVAHDAVPPGAVPERVRTFEAPCGIYDLAPPRANEFATPEVAVPDSARVLLSFGHWRDNKNIDLLIRALAQIEGVHLVIAGPPPSSGQRPATFYADLARSCGVEGRVHSVTEYVPDARVAAFFDRADWVALTYSASFLSQSAVLNVAARARKPVLASSGPGPLRGAVEKYRLGVFVEPDSLEAVIGGLRRLMDNPPEPDWDGYEAFASWDANARVVIEASGIFTGESQRP